jgi:cytochrome c peroxidase
MSDTHHNGGVSDGSSVLPCKSNNPKFSDYETRRCLARAGPLVFVCVLIIVGARLASSYCTAARQAVLDRKLQKVVELYGLRPLSIRRFEADSKWKLGQALFFDQVLSGNRDVSCATCHLLQNGLSDGLPRSIGANGEGLGVNRKLLRGLQVHPRHSLDLWNRDNNAVSSFFWDGHVEVLVSHGRWPTLMDETC